MLDALKSGLELTLHFDNEIDVRYLKNMFKRDQTRCTQISK